MTRLNRNLYAMLNRLPIFVILCFVMVFYCGMCSVKAYERDDGENNIDSKCVGLFEEPVVASVINYGKVSYKSVPHSEILKLDNLHKPEKTRGVTVAGVRVSYDLELVRKKVDNGICIGVKSIKFFAGYPKLSVLIDNKYPEGSCEYEAIKKHEKGHVSIYQKELKYYGDLILSYLRNIGHGVISPAFYRKNVSDSVVRAKIDSIVASNPVMAILVKLDDTLRYQNAEYDNETEYRRVQSECSNW